MAHKKGQGSTKNGRDSNAQFRGIKLYGGETAKAGAIIVRQCGTVWKPGYLVYIGKDHSLMAKAAGTVRYRSGCVDIIPSDPATPHYTVVCRAPSLSKAV